MTIRRAGCVVVVVVSCLLLSEGTARAQCAVVNAAVPPAITLATGASPEFYFRENGVQSLLLGRNPAGWDTDGSAGVNTEHFDELFGYASASERIVRIHVIVGARPNPVLAGDVDCSWLSYRPVTASLSGTIDWPLVNTSNIDFIQLHPYSSTFGPGNLDEMILTFVRDRRLDYPDRPLFIGESGLHYLSPDNAGNLYTLDEPGARTGSSADWLVEFYDTENGALLPLLTIDADQDPFTGDITFTLPSFTGSIAFKVAAVGPLDADIDIIPAGSQNRINISTPGTIPVAIFPTPDLDVTTVDVTSVRFGPLGAPYRSYSFVDTNSDGIVDYLRMRFRKVDAGFSCGDTEGVLTGQTLTGRSFVGSDSVQVRQIPPC